MTMEDPVHSVRHGRRSKQSKKPAVNHLDGYNTRHVCLGRYDPLDRLEEFCEQTSLTYVIHHTAFKNGILAKCILYQRIPFGAKKPTRITEVCTFSETTNLLRAKQLVSYKMLASLDLNEMCEEPKDVVPDDTSHQLQDVVRDFLKSCGTDDLAVSRLDDLTISFASGNADVTKVLDTALSMAESSAQTSATRDYVRGIRDNIDYSAIDEQILKEMDDATTTSIVGDLVDSGLMSDILGADN